jgi:DNA-binding response OmpR family regulator
MRLLVAENDSRVRAALALFLQQQPQCEISECVDVDSLVIQIRSFRPDFLLLDWELPGRPAAALLGAFSEPTLQPKIIALSCRPEAETAALAAGAAFFFCKADPPERLLAALLILTHVTALC